MSRSEAAEGRITEEVRALASMNIDALRAEWRARYGPPPSLRSTDHIRRLLAWRIQAEAFGGLEGETRRALLKNTRKTSGPRLGPGVRLAREWKGERHEVEVLDRGVEYRGRTYESLSHVAREITGVRWNGPRFFGLREEPAKS